MKKKLLVLSVIGLVSFTVILLRENIMLKGKINIGTDNVEKIKHKDMLSMMLETEAGSGKYEMVTRDSWPTEDYTFNSILSKCENGGELSWDDENKIILMSGNLSDKCYVYFDKIMTLSEFVIAQYNGVQGNNNIYYHNSTLENGAGDNSYRYAGSSDTTNNYVCFGSDAETCPEDNLYRIIGVFDGQVKLIKATIAKKDLLGADGAAKSSDDLLFTWSNLSTCPSDTIAYIQNSIVLRLAKKNIIGAVAEPSTEGCNIWKYSVLNTINLNFNYLNRISNVWSNMIESTIWKVSGNSTIDVNPKEMYLAEITNATKTYGPSDGTSKIGLMYASDYGYAASPSIWKRNLSSYGNTSENWLYLYDGWLLTPKSIDSKFVFVISSNGKLVSSSALSTNRVRPVFYLLPSVTYSSGDGTKDAPIRIN